MRIPALCLLAFALFSCLGCQSREETPAVWFVHATDPHLFEGDVSNDKGVRSYQEKADQEAFSALIRNLGSLPGMDSRSSFLLVTGDLGLDGVADAAAAQVPTISASPQVEIARESAVNLLAEQLKASPVKDIYLVLGNNDVKAEAPAGAPVSQAAALLADVQKRLAGTGVVLHDLTSCYRDRSQLPAGCVFDVPGTDFRLIGFSSFSFKNGENRAAANQKSQEEQVRDLETMVDQAGAQGKKVLIVAHIPEIDDPYSLGQFEGAGQAPVNRTGWARFSPWNVSDPVYQTWKRVVDSETVAGVLAGHFHDSHKELYYRPYRWAGSPPERADLRKLFLAPPLSVRFQDTSPVQARGFSLFRLRGDGIRRSFYWYEPKDKTFKPDAPLPKPGPGPNPFSAVIAWLWQVVLVKPDLARAVVMAVAFLAAFLTAVQLWEIPPTQSRLASPAAAAEPQPPPSGTMSVLTSNFAKTVLAGLGGMLALDFLGPVWNLQDINAKPYYVLMFIIFFFLMLLLYALLQSLVEGLRSRISTRQQPVSPSPAFSRRHGSQRGDLGPRFGRWIAYWQHRIWRWLLSLRSFALIFLDTFFNVIRGKNQLRTKVFEDTIIDLHRSIIRTAERVREEVDATIVAALARKEIRTSAASDIRVNVTILSEDESTLYYVSREQGSLPVPFEKHSVAWVSVYTGEARWFKQEYQEKKDDILLLDNTVQRYPGLPAVKLTLGSYFQIRVSPDYEAFLILPFPLGQRGIGAGYRRGAIQISFLKERYLEALWHRLDKPGESHEPDYEGRWQHMLDPRLMDPELGAVLHEALLVLGELFRSFNDAVFEDYIKPSLQASS